MIESSKRTVSVIKNNKEEEVEVLTGYSWRNFFSGINFLKIMQKLSKGRSHRIWLLVQFKSTVSADAWQAVFDYIHDSGFPC